MNSIPAIFFLRRATEDRSVEFVCENIARFGYTPEDFTSGRIPYARLVHPEDLERVQGEVSSYSEAGVSGYTQQYRIVTRSGDVRWVDDWTWIRRGPRGDITHYQGLVIDITRRKQAEDARRRWQHDYEALVSSVDGIVWEADARTLQFSFVSQQAERLLGYPIERWLTEPTFWKDHIHPDDQEWAVAFCTEATRGKRAHDFEYRMMAVDGRMVWLRDIVTVVVEQDQPVKVRGVMVDVTERKQAETALRQSEERYRELFENANDIIYTHDMAGDFTSLNKAAERVTGYTRDEALTMNIAQVVAPEHLERARQMIAHKGASGVLTTYEIDIVAKDGRRVTFEVSSRLILKDGQPAGVEGIARDITERRRLEEQLRQSQKLEAVGLLAGGVAHDFNNLLNGIIGFAELALRELPEGSRGHEHLSRVPPMGQQAADLVGQLLTFARKAPLELKLLDLNLLLEETGKILRRTLPENLTIRADFCPERLMIKADYAQVQQTLLNLATNARDAMPRGGTLTIRLAAVRFTEESLKGHAARRPGAFTCVTVADTGPGIPASIRDRIFDPFFTTKEPGKGSGLGLTSVYGIVHHHEGWIEVETVEPHGVSFHVFLPLLPSQAASDPPPAAPVPRGTETLLLVEDDPIVRELGEILLTELGYTALTAADGVEALAIFRAHPEIALVLTDAVMPRMGAADLVPALRSLNPEVKVLVATGYAPEQIRTSLKHLRLSGYIAKPFRQSDLATAVRAALDGP